MYIPFKLVKVGDEYRDANKVRMLKIETKTLIDKSRVNCVILEGEGKGELVNESAIVACIVPDDYEYIKEGDA